MDLPELLILDVGHGNCAVLHDTGGVTIIDCAPGTTLKETLELLGITEVLFLLISHADDDHVGGLIGLLQDPQITVHHIYINPDAMKRTEIWRDVRIALAEARKTKPTQVHPQLTADLTGSLDAGQVHLEVLAPSQEFALSAVGGEDLEGRRVTSNSMSAVIGLSHNGRRVALITGDLDRVGLANLLSTVDEIQAEVLVFPHHGGKPGSAQPGQFASELCNRVQPRLVVFSVARSRAGFPRRDVVESIRLSAPDAHVACTQLSQECATDAPTAFEHLTDYPARGRPKNSCCAGTIRIGIGEEGSYDDFVREHGNFITSIAPTMCRKADGI
jgi:beta-lactamase superfamily II metal-dependent hydrolase